MPGKKPSKNASSSDLLPFGPPPTKLRFEVDAYAQQPWLPKSRPGPKQTAKNAVAEACTFWLLFRNKGNSDKTRVAVALLL